MKIPTEQEVFDFMEKHGCDYPTAVYGAYFTSFTKEEEEDYLQKAFNTKER